MHHLQGSQNIQPEKSLLYQFPICTHIAAALDEKSELVSTIPKFIRIIVAGLLPQLSVSSCLHFSISKFSVFTGMAYISTLL